MLGRRRVIGTAAAMGLARPAMAQAVPELQTMRSTAKSWIWLAEDYANAAGHFAQAGVKVTSNASSRGTNVPSLAGGGVDVLLGDPGEAMNALGQGFPVRSFVQTVARYASHVVVRKEVLDAAGVTEESPVAAKVAVLKGLRMGTTGPGAAPDNLLRWLSVQGGMDPNRDVRLVPIQGGGPGMVAGLQQKVIDGFCLSSPTADLAVARAGCAYLFDMAANPPPQFAPYCYIIASCAERTLREKREALVRYAMGIALALRSIQRDPAVFKGFAVPFLELDPAIADRAFASNGRIYFADPTPTAELFQKNVDFLDLVHRTQNEPPLPASLRFEAMFDAGVAAEAVKRLG